jgi:hypothetical protein
MISSVSAPNPGMSATPRYPFKKNTQAVSAPRRLEEDTCKANVYNTAMQSHFTRRFWTLDFANGFLFLTAFSTLHSFNYLCL